MEELTNRIRKLVASLDDPRVRDAEGLFAASVVRRFGMLKIKTRGIEWASFPVGAAVQTVGRRFLRRVLFLEIGQLPKGADFRAAAS